MHAEPPDHGRSAPLRPGESLSTHARPGLFPARPQKTACLPVPHSHAVTTMKGTSRKKHKKGQEREPTKMAKVVACSCHLASCSGTETTGFGDLQASLHLESFCSVNVFHRLDLGGSPHRWNAMTGFEICPGPQGSGAPQNTSALRWPGIEPGSTAWKAAMLTTIPPTLHLQGRREMLISTLFAAAPAGALPDAYTAVLVHRPGRLSGALSPPPTPRCSRSLGFAPGPPRVARLQSPGCRRLPPLVPLPAATGRSSPPASRGS